jgi:hypothetical protein
LQWQSQSHGNRNYQNNHIFEGHSYLPWQARLRGLIAIAVATTFTPQFVIARAGTIAGVNRASDGNHSHMATVFAGAIPITW